MLSTYRAASQNHGCTGTLVIIYAWERVIYCWGTSTYLNSKLYMAPRGCSHMSRHRVLLKRDLEAHVVLHAHKYCPQTLIKGIRSVCSVNSSKGNLCCNK